MPILKKKSFIVALVSSFILSVVLILTLIGYVTYLELKDKELKVSYEHQLEELKTR